MSYQPSPEIFWQLFHDCIYIYNVLVRSLRQVLLKQKAHLYVNCIAEFGTPLLSFNNFMDGTQTFMYKSSEHSTRLEFFHSRQKRRHSLVHLAVTNPDGLRLYLHGSELGRRHDIIIYRQSGLDATLEYHS